MRNSSCTDSLQSMPYPTKFPLSRTKPYKVEITAANQRFAPTKAKRPSGYDRQETVSEGCLVRGFGSRFVVDFGLRS